jgi:hypothetical protein
MKDKCDRLQAENLLLSSDSVALRAENKMLLDRLRVVEAQLAVLNASASTVLHELSKQREINAKLTVNAATDDDQGRTSGGHVPLQPGECVVAGVVMEKEVALWLKDVYVTLLHHPETIQTIEALRRGSSAAPSSSALEPPEVASVTRVSSAVSRPSAAKCSRESSAQVRSARTASNTTNATSAMSFADHVASVRAGRPEE